MSERKQIVIYLSRPPDGGIGMRIAGTTPEEFSDLLGCFKACIPASARSYDPELKLWVIDSAHYVPFRGWCASVVRKFGGRARVSDNWVGVRTSPSTPAPHPDIDTELALRELHLLPGALDHPELLRLVFEYLCAERHEAGDEEGMNALVVSYETLTHTLQLVA